MAVRDLAEGGHAQAGASLLRADLGEFLLDCGEADAEPFDLAEPSLTFGFGYACVEVVADFLEPGVLGGASGSGCRLL
jgi:hypothetical protein